MSSVKPILLAGLLLGTSATAQLLPPLGPVTNQLVGALPGPVPVAGELVRTLLSPAQQRAAVSPTLDSLGLGNAVAALPAADLLDLRRQRQRQLVRDHPQQLDSDGDGNPVRRGEIVVIAPGAAALQAAAAAGFTVAEQRRDSALGLELVILATPRAMRAREALARLRRLAPGIEADLNHVYEPAGGPLAAAAMPLAVTTAAAASGSVRIAMIDGGVASHPSLTGTAIEQHGFAGPVKATGHGTAVASLLVGRDGSFHGALPGASLLVADVYGGSRAAGSATAIAQALGWAAAKRPQVITISLVGPPNRLLERAVAALASRGIALVAAVGNDGPAAPPQYPASYRPVVAATGVDRNRRALPEAGRPTELDFAAPGADLAAALPGRGYARVRGTSFAAPFVAARLAAAGSEARLASEAVPGKGRVGRGIVCSRCPVEPRLVGAK